MAEIVLTDAVVVVNSVDLSDHVRQVTVSMSVEEKDLTAMGASGKARRAGLRDDSYTLEFNQDFDAAEVDATLFPLLGAAPFPVSVKPTSAATSATNPDYNGNSIITDYNPIDGAVGDELVTSITLPVDGVISRSTS
jgi:hypothetical protein